jgi:hypothetical protein
MIYLMIKTASLMILNFRSKIWENLVIYSKDKRVRMIKIRIRTIQLVYYDTFNTDTSLNL